MGKLSCLVWLQESFTNTPEDDSCVRGILDKNSRATPPQWPPLFSAPPPSLQVTDYNTGVQRVVCSSRLVCLQALLWTASRRLWSLECCPCVALTCDVTVIQGVCPHHPLWNTSLQTSLMGNFVCTDNPNPIIHWTHPLFLSALLWRAFIHFKLL